MRLAAVFKEAIEQADWSTVCDVYKAITGKEITPPDMPEDEEPEGELADIQMPEKPTKRIGKKKQNTRHPEGDFIAESKGKIQNSEKGQRVARKEPIPSEVRQNRFEDDQTIKASELVTKKPYLGVANPRPRGNLTPLENHEPTTLVDVVCCLCKKHDKVSVSLSHGYSENELDNVWKCNDCCTSGGRRKLNKR
jgi:hypothetical protein